MNTKRVGQSMMTASLIGGMIMLTYFFSGIEQKKQNPNSYPETRAFADAIEVPLVQNRQGHYLVGGKINSEKVTFLLDTGATDVVVPESTARDLGLGFGRKGVAITANGRVVIHETSIDRLEIGEITLVDVKASINPGMPRGAILLGMSALSKIEFTQTGKTLTLRQRYL